jgi:pimeloyl-ACP methyl ester carboxylesterase
MMEVVKNKLVCGKHEKPIVTDVLFHKNGQKKPVVIFCHGYKGYKDWGVFDKMGSSFVNEELFLVKFNFSHNGGTPSEPIDFPDLEAFGNNNFVKELDDLESILDWLESNADFSDEIDLNNISLIGHSRGGGIITLKASEDSRIQKIISWASVSDYEARFPVGEVLDYWKKEGVAYIENARTKQQMPHYFQFYNNFIENKERLNIQLAAERLQIPHLIIHGTEDPTVSLEEAKRLHKWSEKSELFLIENADHGFGAKQPWTEDFLPKDFVVVLEKTISFIKSN